MSTRCNIIIKDSRDSLTFYRHSDGYPDGVAKTLNQFMSLLTAGIIRDNVEQAAGWLIIIGHKEYEELQADYEKKFNKKFVGMDWKVGTYEPATCIHSDIEFLYEIDLAKRTLTGWRHNGKDKGECITSDIKEVL